MTSPDPDRSARGARLVSAGILISRILGLVRLQVFAHFLTGTHQADAYTAALKIPNVLRNLLGEGAVSASFVPVYAAALERGDVHGARALANALLGVLLAGVAVLTLLGMALAPVITPLIISGASDETVALTTRLLRVMFPMAGLMVLSGWCLGVQNAHRRFFMAYASAALWSVAQIALLLAAGPTTSDLTQLVWWLSWATLGGAVLQIGAQVPQVWRLMVTVRPTLDAAAPGLRATLTSWVPVVSTLGLANLSGFVDMGIASWLPEGAITNINYAQTLYMLPLSLFAVATAAAALPELSRQGVSGAAADISASIARAWERVLFYTIPSAVAFIAIGDAIVGLIYRGGAFDADAQRVVHLVLAAYALGLTAYASARVLVSAFQAARDYRTPLVSAAWSLSTSAVAAAAIALPFREHMSAAAGIALGSAVGAHVNVVLLARRLRARAGSLDLRGPAAVASRTLLASLAAAVAGYGAHAALPDLHVRLTALIVIPAYCLTFLVAARWLGLAESHRVVSGLMRRFGRR